VCAVVTRSIVAVISSSTAAGNDRGCRVFFRYSCEPDIEIGFCDQPSDDIASDIGVKVVEKPDKDGYFVAAAPPGEIKPILYGFDDDEL
jgi:hypothetical protein